MSSAMSYIVILASLISLILLIKNIADTKRMNIIKGLLLCVLLLVSFLFIYKLYWWPRIPNLLEKLGVEQFPLTIMKIKSGYNSIYHSIVSLVSVVLVVNLYRHRKRNPKNEQTKSNRDDIDN